MPSRTLLDTVELENLPLTTGAPRLSKSRLVQALQCDRRLWLAVHRPDLLVIDAATQAIFDAGHQVGEVARDVAIQEWGQGELIDVNEPQGWEGGWLRCQELLQRARHTSTSAVLFEAPFTGPDFAVIADIVVRQSDGEIWLIEVKSSTRLEGKPHIDDATFQADAMARSGFRPDRVFVRLIDTSFIYGGDGDYRGLFRDEDVTDAVLARLPLVARFVERSRAVAGGSEPQVRTGAQCSTPYDCPFRSHCDAWQTELDGPPPAYPIELLARRNVGRLSALERHQIDQHVWVDVRDVPEGFLSDARAEDIARAIRSGQPWIAPGLKVALSTLLYPRFYFDFETINPAVPIWAGTRPYQQVPFQWSCHIEHADGRLEHHEFLDTTGSDPRPECAKQLVELMGGTQGCVLVYFQAFEEARLRELARDLPAFAAGLQRVIDKLCDLLPIIRAHYYHPEQQGSYSIKAVLPTVVPDLDYSGLEEVRDGGGAQRAYLELIDRRTDEARTASLTANLRAYCERDTQAMVELVRRLSA
jgi:hypothetical protein